MAIRLQFTPNFAVDTGRFAPGAKVRFFLSGTMISVNVFQDAGLTTPHPVPVVANASGQFPEVWTAGTQALKAIITDANDATIDTVDPVTINGTLSPDNAAVEANAAAAAASAAAAATSETNAETAEDNAASSAATATTQAGIATTQAGIATTQAGIATTQAGNAASSAAAAATFDPALYLAKADNLSDVANAATARANIGLQYASEAEAEAGTSNIRAMTPLRTADAIAAQRPVSTNADFSVDPTSLADRETIADYVVGRDLQGGTPVATTSGTAFNFTSIPAGVQEIDVIFSGVSLNGAGNLLVQVGTSGGITTTGYVSLGGGLFSGGAGTVTSTSGFIIRAETGLNYYLTMTLRRLADGSNIWVSTHAGSDASGVALSGGGSITLGAELDRVRITRTGSNTFDAGNLNVRWR